MFRPHSQNRASGVLAVLLLAAVLLPACRGPAGNATPAEQGPGAESQAGQNTARPALEPSFPAGAFVIRSNPLGATVYVDGRLIGQTPLAYRRDDGQQHLVYLTLEGYASQLAFRDFTGEGIMVDLALVESGREERQSLEARSLLPEVTPIQNPAGSRAWQVNGLAPFTAAISPNGRYLVALAHAAEGQANRIDTVAVDLRSGEARQVAGHIDNSRLSTGGLNAPVGWLGDSQVAILTQREPADDPENPALSLLKVDLATGQQEPMGDFGRWAEGLVRVNRSWLTSDGKRAFVHVSGHIWGLDLATKQRVLDLPVPTWDGRFTVAPSPDGWSVAHLDYDQKKGNALVCWLNLRTGEDKPVSPPDMYAQGAWWSPDGKRLAFGVSPRHADGYPTLPQEDSTFLLPDAVEIVDLPALTRQHIDLPGTPAVVAMAGDFEHMVVTRVAVTGDRNLPEGWGLQRRGLFRLNLTTGEVSGETPPAPPAGTYVQGVRPEGDAGYLVTLSRGDGFSLDPQEWQGTRLARLHPDGHMEMLPGYVVDAAYGTLVREDWPLLRFDDGLGWADGRRLLAGPAAKKNFSVRLASRGWILLTGLTEATADEITVVANPPVR